MRNLAASVIGCLLITGAACDDTVIHYIDPPIRLSGQDGGGPSGPPELNVGFTARGVYTDLADDPSLMVIHGLQGGTWTMPTVRSQGIGAFATITCEVTTDGGELVGVVDVRTLLFPSVDGPLQVEGFPIPIQHAPPHEAAPIDDLYGQAAALTCSITDADGHSAAADYSVTLVEG